MVSWEYSGLEDNSQLCTKSRESIVVIPDLFFSVIGVTAKYDISVTFALSKKSTDLPHLNWSSAMFMKWRTENGQQTTEAGREYLEVTAS